MRVFRFLQARPYWLYKVAGVLVVVAFVLTGIYRLLANSVPFLYPLVMWLLPVGINGLLVMALLAIPIEIVIAVTRKPRNAAWKHLGFAVLIVVFIFAGLAISGPDIPPLAAHISSLHYNGMYTILQGRTFSGLLVGLNHLCIYSMSVTT